MQLGFYKNLRKGIDICPYKCYHVITVKGNRSNFGGKSQKGEPMNDDMNTSELLVEKAEENQTRKILDILEKSKDLAEGIEKVRALLNK